MLSTNKELRQIFLSQTEELLLKLETQGLLAGTDTHYDDRLSVTDLVLHTIKGDAGAVGLADVSSAAKLCLALVRSKGKAGCEVWRRAGGNELLVEFVKAVRGCLGQVRASGKGGEENFVLLGRLLRYAMSDESSEPMGGWDPRPGRPVQAEPAASRRFPTSWRPRHP
jgi:chemotaxis protein histidine kinase CheA